MLVVCDKSVDTTKAGRMRIGHGARVYTNLEAARTCILPPSRGGDPAEPRTLSRLVLFLNRTVYVMSRYAAVMAHTPPAETEQQHY